ncbi:MAG: hypothetical protein AVDCRST_MAG11-3861, partial [uncultured Gemmatimonadaceae bacterium]
VQHLRVLPGRRALHQLQPAGRRAAARRAGRGGEPRIAAAQPAVHLPQPEPHHRRRGPLLRAHLPGERRRDAALVRGPAQHAGRGGVRPAPVVAARLRRPRLRGHRDVHARGRAARPAQRELPVRDLRGGRRRRVLLRELRRLRAHHDRRAQRPAAALAPLAQPHGRPRERPALPLAGLPLPGRRGAREPLHRLGLPLQPGDGRGVVLPAALRRRGGRAAAPRRGAVAGEHRGGHRGRRDHRRGAHPPAQAVLRRRVAVGARLRREPARAARAHDPQRQAARALPAPRFRPQRPRLLRPLRPGDDADPELRPQRVRVREPVHGRHGAPHRRRLRPAPRGRRPRARGERGVPLPAAAPVQPVRRRVRRRGRRERRVGGGARDRAGRDPGLRLPLPLAGWADPRRPGYQPVARRRSAGDHRKRRWRIARAGGARGGGEPRRVGARGGAADVRGLQARRPGGRRARPARAPPLDRRGFL